MATFTSGLLISLSFCVWLASPQQQPLNQYQQYQMLMLNRDNGRGVQTVAFMMERGHPNTGANLSQFITFDTTTIANNVGSGLSTEFSVFGPPLPGLYFLSYRIAGANATESTEVQMKIHRNTTDTTTTFITAVSRASELATANALVMLAVNDRVYLETTQGTLYTDTANTSMNSFLGILMVGEQSNPFLQSLFNNNNNNNMNNNNNNLQRNLQALPPGVP